MTVGNSYQDTYDFRANSLFDPDASGIGTQPYGYDDYLGINAPFYRYKVFASKITVYINRITGGPCKVIVVPTRTSSLTYTEACDLMSVMPYSRTNLISLTDTSRQTKVSCYCSMKKILGQAVLSDEDYQTTYDANTSPVVFFHLFFDATSVSTDVALDYDVKIVYYAQVTKTDNVDQS